MGKWFKRQRKPLAVLLAFMLVFTSVFGMDVKTARGGHNRILVR